MRGKKITVEDVRIMRRLRDEEGLSNNQIAERLDLSCSTVIRCIGKQGFRSASMEVPAREPAQIESKNPKCALPIIRRRVTLKGLAITIDLDSDSNMCEIRSNSDSMQFEAIVPCELLEQIGLELIEASKF